MNALLPIHTRITRISPERKPGWFSPEWQCARAIRDEHSDSAHFV